MNHIISVIIGFLCSISISQNQKEKDFATTINSVVNALSSRDSAQLNRYIEPATGVYILHRPGIMDTYRHYTTLGFTDSTYPNSPFYDGVRLTRLIYSRLPTYDCVKWSKTGTFVDTTVTSRLLSTTAKNLNKEFGNEYPAGDIKKFIDLENRSRRVVIAEDNGNELIIYLGYINKKWYLTIIDKVTADCST